MKPGPRRALQPATRLPVAGRPADAAPGAPGTTDLAIYRAIFDTASVGIFQSTPAGKFVRVNRALATLLGYAGPEAMLAASTDVARQHYVRPADRDAFTAQLLAQGRVEGFVVEGRRCDDSRIWCSMSATAIRDENGAIDSIIGTVVDVSDLVEAQDRLSAAAAEMGRVFDNATEGIYRSAPDGRMLRANPALVRLNGYDSEAALLGAVHDIGAEWYVAPERRDEFKAALERDGRVTGFESEVYRHRTRERIWVSENAWVVRDKAGQVLFYEGTVVDVTERHRAAAALHDNEQRLRDYAETASDFFWETDSEHRFSRMSPRVAVLGVAPTRNIGMTRFEIAGDRDREPEKWLKHRETLDRHEPFRDFVYRNELDQGRFVYVSVSGKPVFDEDGAFLGYRGSARDVTAAMEAEERLRQAMTDAEAANQAKISFLANMSHELRTPLNAILGFSEMIRDQLLGPGSPRYAEYAGFISDSGTHLLSLVNDVLDMAKIDAGRLELAPCDVDLNDLVRRQAAMMAPRAMERGVTIVEDAPDGRVVVHADDLRMRQIVLNLLSNAVKFSKPAGQVAVVVRVERDGRPAILVQDQGIGMTAEEIQLALQPFRQIETHMDRQHEGTGLGLPITKNLVELHGGELAIESAPGRGTTVRVLLPATALRAAAPA